MGRCPVHSPPMGDGCRITQRAVCCAVSTLGGRRGRWARKGGVSGPDGSEEGRWGEVVRTQERRKARMTGTGAKSRKCRKDERSKRKKQNRTWATTLSRKETEQEEGRGRKRCRFDPWVGKIPRRMKWQPTPVLLPGKSHGQRSLAGGSPQGLRTWTRLSD